MLVVFIAGAWWPVVTVLRVSTTMRPVRACGLARPIRTPGIDGELVLVHICLVCGQTATATDTHVIGGVGGNAEHGPVLTAIQLGLLHLTLNGTETVIDLGELWPADGLLVPALDHQ